MQKICILEDDADIRLILKIILTDLGFGVSCYENRTLFYIGQEKTLPDLYLLDINLPDGNGLEICLELKSSQKFGNIPVVLMSANFREKDVLTLFKADSFINKPFNIDELVSEIKLHLPK